MVWQMGVGYDYRVLYSMVRQENSPVLISERVRLKYGCLDPLELGLLTGSSVEIRGERIDLDDLFFRARSGDLDAMRDLPTPQDILNGKAVPVRQIEQQRRQFAVAHEPRGMIGVFDGHDLMALGKMGIQVSVRIPTGVTERWGKPQIDGHYNVFFWRGDSLVADPQHLKLGFSPHHKDMLHFIPSFGHPNGHRRFNVGFPLRQAA